MLYNTITDNTNNPASEIYSILKFVSKKYPEKQNSIDTFKISHKDLLNASREYNDDEFDKLLNELRKLLEITGGENEKI